MLATGIVAITKIIALTITVVLLVIALIISAHGDVKTWLVKHLSSLVCIVIKDSRKSSMLMERIPRFVDYIGSLALPFLVLSAAISVPLSGEYVVIQEIKNNFVIAFAALVFVMIAVSSISRILPLISLSR